ncbi:unnamed protein product [Musa banksii]
MQSDRMVISLRPGGGAGNCPPWFDSASSGCDSTIGSFSVLPILRPAGAPLPLKIGESRSGSHEHAYYTRD